MTDDKKPILSNVTSIADAMKPKQTIETQKIERTVTVNQANSLLSNAGRIIKPEGFEYLGSAAVHYYIKDGDMHDKKIAFGNQIVSLPNEENIVYGGFKYLRKRCMEYFNRTESSVDGDPEVWKS